MNDSRSRGVGRCFLRYYIDDDYRFWFRSARTDEIGTFGPIGSGIVASLDRVHRDGTLCARWNAHRNERLTWVGVVGKMPMEPRFERRPANG